MPRPRPMISYAQNHEDVLLDRVFHDVSAGTYVDVGANHPHIDSMTKHFYLNGWRGVNIEPGLVFEALAAERPEDVNVNCAVSLENGTRTFREFANASGLSSLEDDLPEVVKQKTCEAVLRPVPTRTLRDILGEYGVTDITFLSVDVEGHERSVLASNDWERFRPRVVVIEATLPTTPIPCHHLWEDVVLAADYRFAFFDGLNRYYVRAEDEALLGRFDAPANVHDDFVPALLAEARQLVNELHQRLVENHQRLCREMEERARAMEEKQWALEILNGYHGRLQEIEGGVGGRSLRIGLWVARRLRALVALGQRKPRHDRAA